MRRPEKHFWYFVALLSTVLLLGASGQLISCAKAQTTDYRAHHPSIHSHRHPGTRWNQPGPSVTSGPGVTLNAQLDRGAILQHGDGIVRVEVAINTAAESGAPGRSESDIIVVVDTSGSMAGEKLHFARQALQELIDRLGPQDRFGLVEYSSSARILAPLTYANEHQKQRFRALTQQLVATGSTNMSDGLDHAISLARSQDRLGRPGRVLLLSDGLANAGDSSLRGLAERARALSYDNVALTTMGIGEDFDENVMTSLATAGTGAFYYLSKLSYLAEFFDNELATTRETYASSAELRFEPARGVSLISAMGLPIEHQGGAQVVRLGSLYGSRTRTVWLTLRVPAHELGPKSIGHLSVGYERQGKPGLVSVGPLPQLVCLNDYAHYQKEIRQPVWERALLNDVFTTTEEQFGDAIRTGSRKELYSALSVAEQERKLAQGLGNHAVLQKLDDLKQKATVAEQAQTAPAAVRNVSAKKSKARGYQMRNSDVYKDASGAMESY